MHLSVPATDLFSKLGLGLQEKEEKVAVSVPVRGGDIKEEEEKDANQDDEGSDGESTPHLYIVTQSNHFLEISAQLHQGGQRLTAAKGLLIHAACEE